MIDPPVGSKPTSEGSLGLYIDGEAITDRRFLKAMNAFFRIVHEVTAEVAGKRDAIEWALEVKGGSIDMVARGLVKRGVQIGAAIVVAGAINAGVKALEANGQRPAYFTDDALRGALELASARDRHGKQVKTLEVRAGNERIPITAQTIATVERLLAVTQTVYGTIEGRLETATQHVNRVFQVYDEVTGRGVECRYDEAQTEDVWKHGGHRVSVSGMITYTASGEPLSMKVEAIAPLDDEPPVSFTEVDGILG